MCPDKLALVTHFGGPSIDRRSGLSLGQKVSIGLQIAGAFDGVHAAGFTHSDIKENICVDVTAAEPVVPVIERHGQGERDDHGVAVLVGGGPALHP